MLSRKLRYAYANISHYASFGKRIEYWIVGLMLKQGLDLYLPPSLTLTPSSNKPWMPTSTSSFAES